jgi:hypothetical protein
MVDGIQSALKDCNVLSFNPHLSSTIMAAQVSQVANALVDRVCPENITLLDDPDDTEGEPWPVRRTYMYPVYIIHDGNPECAQVATKAKEFFAGKHRPELLTNRHSVNCEAEQRREGRLRFHLQRRRLCATTAIVKHAIEISRAVPRTCSCCNGVPMVLSNLVASTKQHKPTAYDFVQAHAVSVHIMH